MVPKRYNRDTSRIVELIIMLERLDRLRFFVAFLDLCFSRVSPNYCPLSWLLFETRIGLRLTELG